MPAASLWYAGAQRFLHIVLESKTTMRREIACLGGEGARKTLSKLRNSLPFAHL